MDKSEVRLLADEEELLKYTEIVPCNSVKSVSQRILNGSIPLIKLHFTQKIVC